VEGTILWLFVVAVVEITAAFNPAQFAPEAFIFAFANLVLAYFCWTGRRFAFLIAVALALLTAVGAYPIPLPSRTVDTFGAEVDTLLVLGSLLVILFGARAYRERDSYQMV
jgi:hypothetical protein